MSPESTSTSSARPRAPSRAQRTASPVPSGAPGRRPRRPSNASAVVGRGDDDERVGAERPRGLDAPSRPCAGRGAGGGASARAERMRVPSPAGHHDGCEVVVAVTAVTMAGAPGFEPGITGPKPVALPLGHAPSSGTAESSRPVRPTAQVAPRAYRRSRRSATSATTAAARSDHDEREHDDGPRRPARARRSAATTAAIQVDGAHVRRGACSRPTNHVDADAPRARRARRQPPANRARERRGCPRPRRSRGRSAGGCARDSRPSGVDRCSIRSCSLTRSTVPARARRSRCAPGRRARPPPPTRLRAIVEEAVDDRAGAGDVRAERAELARAASASGEEARSFGGRRARSATARERARARRAVPGARSSKPCRAVASSNAA